MRMVLERTEHLSIRQMEVTELIVEDGVLTGVKTVFRGRLSLQGGDSVYGDISEGALHLRQCECLYRAKRLQAANYLTDSLKGNGVKMYRFKTGTPARIAEKIN